MEQVDRDMILSLSSRDSNLKRLYHEHVLYETKLLELQRRKYLTPEEQLEERRMKKEKLHGVDRMMEILSRRRVSRHAQAA